MIERSSIRTCNILGEPAGVEALPDVEPASFLGEVS